MKFTDKSIQALKPRSIRYEVWEKGKTGFGLRITPRGVKSFIWLYRFEGKSKRLTLGNYPALGLYEGNKALAEARRQLALGIDPGVKIIEKKRDHRQAVLVVNLVEEYLEKYAKPNKRSADEDERILKKDIVPRWGHQKAKDVTKKDVIALLDDILNRGAPIAANRTLACVRKIFNWANSRDILEVNPCASIKLPSRENHRDRVLADDEMANLWHNLEKVHMSGLIRLALKLQLVTAQRKSEILQARWNEIDWIHKIWIIPSENAKNRLAHRVPLSRLACSLLERIKEISGSSGYLFPSPTTSRTIQGSSVDHALRNNRAKLEVQNVTPHDLRRTAASHMASLGINRLVISKILNHVEQSVTSIYDRYGYDTEKRQALDTWSHHLSKILKKEEHGKH